MATSCPIPATKKSGPTRCRKKIVSSCSRSAGRSTFFLGIAVCHGSNPDAIRPHFKLYHYLLVTKLAPWPKTSRDRGIANLTLAERCPLLSLRSFFEISQIRRRLVFAGGH